jgi:hypothetical protein
MQGVNHVQAGKASPDHDGVNDGRVRVDGHLRGVQRELNGRLLKGSKDGIGSV